MSPDPPDAELAERVFEDGQAPSAVLLLAPVMASGYRRGCHTLLHPAPPRNLNLLVITYRESGDAWLEAWREAIDDGPAGVAVLSVEESFGSAPHEGDAASDPMGAGENVIRTVEHPEDLTGLGIYLSECIDAWESSDRRTVMCLDSVTAMLQYVDMDTAFRFLDVCTGRLRAIEGTTHVHMDPGAHDERTINRITQLFDAVVEDEGEEDWTVRMA